MTDKSNEQLALKAESYRGLKIRHDPAWPFLFRCAVNDKMLVYHSFESLCAAIDVKLAIRHGGLEIEMD